MLTDKDINEIFDAREIVLEVSDSKNTWNAFILWLMDELIKLLVNKNGKFRMPGIFKFFAIVKLLAEILIRIKDIVKERRGALDIRH